MSIATLLKWMTVALGILALLSTLASLYAMFQLNFGACRNGCEQANVLQATFQAGLVGLTGFGVSALSAHLIRQSFRNGD